MDSVRQVATKAVEAFNSHEADRIRAYYADNVVLEAPGDVRMEGPDAATEFSMAWLRAFPDLRLTVHNETIDGDCASQEFTFEGTHQETLASPGGEIPATGRRVVGRGAQFFRIKGGTIVEEKLYYDQVQLLTQLGLMPEPAAATTG